MKSIENLTIGEAREIARIFGNNCTEDNYAPAKNGDIVIAALQRGWVYVGEYSQDGSTATLSNAKCIRRWGTSKGLGEIAENGPTGDTELDPCPPIKFHVREAVFIMEVNKDAWRK